MLQLLGQGGESRIGDSQITFSDLSTITLQKHRSFKFLTSFLQKEGITYHWGFPFKLIVRHDSKNTLIRTVQEAELFLEKLQKKVREGLFYY